MQPETDHAADLRLSELRLSRQCTLYRGLQFSEACFQITLDVRAERTASALGQHIEITARLSRFDHAETGAMRRDRQIRGIVGRNLQKPPPLFQACLL